MKNENLGRKAVDKITGFRGVITGHAEYLTGCDQYLIQPKTQGVKNDIYPEAHWFDEGRLDIGKIDIEQTDVVGEENGCDYTAPIK